MRRQPDAVWLVCVCAAALCSQASAQVAAGAATTAESVRPAYPSLSLLGFSDLNFAAIDQEGLASNSGFFEGQFVLHMSSSLSQRFTFFGELSFSARRDAATSASAPGFGAEVERAILKYNQSDALKLSVGRFHTPVSYWNVAFHHGQWLQTSVARPDMIEFGTEFLPVHFVGAFAEGEIPSGGLRLQYNLGAGNGRSAVLSRAGDAGDVNNNRALLAALVARPDWASGLQAGGAVYLDKLSARGLAHRERILSAHVAWTKDPPELIAEYASVRHRPIGAAGSFASWAYYVQLAYRTRLADRRVKPYARWDELRVDAADVAFASLADRKELHLGARFDASDYVAVKGEYRRQQRADAGWVNGIVAQVSFSF
jgi:hypothetical protein